MNIRGAITAGYHRAANLVRSAVASVWISNKYDAAQTDAWRSNIGGPLRGARSDISPATRAAIVKKSRDFECNSHLLNRLCDLFEQYTVGGGIQFQPASSSEKWNAAAKAFWESWSQLPDATSKQHLGTIQSLTARNWFIDGDVFIHLTKGKTWVPRIQLFESHLVGTPSGAGGDENIFDGIKTDPETGRPVSYMVGRETSRYSVTDHTPISEGEIIHVWEPSRPQQMRGLPFAYPVLNLLHDLKDLHALEIAKARQVARIAIKRTTESGKLDPDDLQREGVTVDADESGRLDYYRESIGGEEIVMKHGDEMDSMRSDVPSATTIAGWSYMEARVCAGIGIPYCIAYPESMQGTVYRGALDMAHAWFQCRHQVIAEAYRKVYEHVMGAARFNVPELRDAPADWKKVRIHPPKAVNVDVGRNSNAMLAELAAGALTYSEIYGAKGQDWREGLAQRKTEQDFVESLGLKVQVTQVASAAQVEQTQQAQRAAQPQEVDA